MRSGFVSTAAAAMLGGVIASATVAPRAHAAPEAGVGALAPRLDEIRARWGGPGIAAAAVRDGKVVALGVSGVRELGKDDGITPDDVFAIGSCTKAMTRLLIARLVDEGRLSFDTTLAAALPGMTMREEYKGVTLSQVMRHQGGLPSYEQITPKTTPIMFELKGTPREKRAQFVAHVLQEAPAAKPGTKMVYSNAGFALLGVVAEQAGGASWEELMTSRVFEPLGMGSARIGRPERGEGGATGHFRSPRGFTVAERGPPLDGALAPAGGVRVNIVDFAKFAAFQAALEGGDGGALLKPATVASLLAARAADASDAEGEVFLGGEGTYTAGFAVWPSKNFGVVVCVNGGDSDGVCEDVVRAVREQAAPDVARGGPRGGPGLAPAAPAGAPGGPRLGAMLRAEEDGRLFIESFEPGTLAERSGFRPGDEIISINGKALAEWEGDERIGALRAAGSKIGVRRDGKDVEITIAGPAE